MSANGTFEVVPASADRWRDVETLFGPKGACAGCWCMFFKQSASEFREGRGAANRDALKRIVESGEVPGLLAYRDGEPVGWCAVEPRERYSRLARSRTLKPVDDRAAWSVPCFFVAKPARRRGVSIALLEAAAEHARSRGAELIEGYPCLPRAGRMPDTFAYIGTVGQFERAGFEEVAAPSPSRRIMRREL
jgi:GNAT superfamily N-acetyltransferase